MILSKYYQIQVNKKKYFWCFGTPQEQDRHNESRRIMLFSKGKKENHIFSGWVFGRITKDTARQKILNYINNQ